METKRLLQEAKHSLSPWERAGVRVIKVTAGNLRNNTLSLRGHLDFFPADAIGPARRNGNGPGGFDLYLDGLDLTVHTDIPRDAKTDKPRHFVRDRKAIGKFYRYHATTAGSYVALARLSERKYALSTANVADEADVGCVKCSATHRSPEGGCVLSRLPGQNTAAGNGAPSGSRPKPRAAEFFAGIGLVRLALERQGWEVVFANDIDEDKAEMYRHNWPNCDHLIVGDIHNLAASDIPDCDLWTASVARATSPSPVAEK